jgi:hypothetical protein
MTDWTDVAVPPGLFLSMQAELWVLASIGFALVVIGVIQWLQR